MPINEHDKHVHARALPSEGTRKHASEIFNVMDDLYDKWQTTFAWGTKVGFSNLPTSFNNTLMDNATLLHRVGRSTAREFWHRREANNYRPITGGGEWGAGPVYVSEKWAPLPGLLH